MLPSLSLSSTILQIKRFAKRRQKLRHADVLVVSQAKSGRTWLAVMISHVYHLRHGIPEQEIIRLDNFTRFNAAVPSVFFTHDNRKDRRRRPLFRPEELQGRRVLLLVRDPRDVAVSAYFQSLRNPGEARYGSSDNGALFDFVVAEKLPQVLAFLQRWAAQIESMDQVELVRYEDLREDPAGELARVMRMIDGREADPAEIHAAVDFAAFDNLRRKEAAGFFQVSRLRPGDASNPDSFKVRRAKVGGYRDYFDADQLAVIEAMVQAADLGRLGYSVQAPPEEARDAIAAETTGAA